MLKIQDIRTVHVEITTRCNARCPMCMRNYRGYDYNGGYPDVELSLSQFKHIFTSKFLHQLSDKKEILSGVNFNGNLGDFALAQDGVEIVKYITSHGTPVAINTNGSLRSPAWWAALAQPNVQIGFAIDGLADTHHLYRQDTNWDRVIENASAYIKAGGKAIWRFVPFDHNRHQEKECRKLARELGFWGFENIYDGRDTGPVYTRDGQYSHFLGKNYADQHLPLATQLESHIHWYDRNKDNILHDVPEIKYDCKHLTNKEIYVAADGTVYPCCFLGFYPKQMHHAGNEQIRNIAMENNALEYDLEHCIKWFDKIEESWKQQSITEGRLYTCVVSCGKTPTRR